MVVCGVLSGDVWCSDSNWSSRRSVGREGKTRGRGAATGTAPAAGTKVGGGAACYQVTGL